MTLTIQTQTVQIANGDLKIDAYLASPVDQALYPAVIVIQEIFGVNSHIRDVTERIARQGYVAIAPAIYQRIAPGYEAGYTSTDLDQGKAYKAQTKAEELISDIQATIHYLYTQPQVKKAGVGCIGFCFGGHVAYLVSVLPEIAATASFYGAGIATMTPGGGSPTIDRTPDIKGTLYAFFGLEDASIPQTEVDQIAAALTQAQIPHQIFRYPGADHGFFCDQRASYNAEAAADAWEQTLALFKSKL